MNDSHIILALDLPEYSKILELAYQLRNCIAMVKIGLEAFTAHGPPIIKDIHAMGVNVFLDLKIHDIPRTAAATAREASRLGVRMLTVHAAGGEEMVRAARESAYESTDIIAVTMLTSLDNLSAKAIGFRSDIPNLVLNLSYLAINAGANGLVCSALELNHLSKVDGKRVVPGIRLKKSNSDDQKRTATPSAAIKNGADWIVVGRPILQADNPLSVVKTINNEVNTMKDTNE